MSENRLGFSLTTRLLRKFKAEGRTLPSKETWEAEYQTGKWNYLRNDDELPRYAILAGYLNERCSGGSILDLGCGDGVLCERLTPGSYGKYLGIDISAEAVARAAALDLAGARFACADVEQFELDESFDAIVINEVLYYFRDPVRVVERFAEALTARGVMLASMYLPSMKTIRRQVAEIDRRASRHHTYTVEHGETGKAWAIKIWCFGPAEGS